MLGRNLRRGLNAAARLRAGLALRPESVTPEAPTDLYQAHLSIYRFFVQYARGRRVLDLGCGSGQGSRALADGGAREVLGIDIDPRSIGYARRRFGGGNVHFEVADAEALPDWLPSLEAVISSNVFEHLERPAAALDRVARILEPGGIFALAIPPIYDDTSRAVTSASPHHRTNRAMESWLAELVSRFEEVRQFAHMPRDGIHPDMHSPYPSRLGPDDFHFHQVDPGAAHPTLTALFLAERPRLSSKAAR